MIPFSNSAARTPEMRLVSKQVSNVVEVWARSSGSVSDETEDEDDPVLELDVEAVLFEPMFVASGLVECCTILRFLDGS